MRFSFLSLRFWGFRFDRLSLLNFGCAGVGLPPHIRGDHDPSTGDMAPYRKCAGPDEPTAYAEETRAEVVNRDREPRLLSGRRTRPTGHVEPDDWLRQSPLQAKHLPSGEWVSLVKSIPRERKERQNLHSFLR